MHDKAAIPAPRRLQGAVCAGTESSRLSCRVLWEEVDAALCFSPLQQGEFFASHLCHEVYPG